MDVRQYFRKVREIEAALSEEYPVVISLETGDGGKAGLLSEVTKLNAAKMLVEGRAALATEDQRKQYFDQRDSAKQAADRTEAAKRLHLAIIEDASLRAQIASRNMNNPSGNGK